MATQPRDAPGKDSPRPIEVVGTDKLRRSELQPFTILDSIDGGIITLDLGRHVTFINRAAERLTQWSREEADHLTLATVFTISTSSHEWDVAKENIFQAKSTAYKGIAILTPRNSDALAIEYRISPLLSIEDEMTGAIIEFEPIKDSNRDREIHRSEHLFRDFFDNASVGLHWVSREGIVIRVNRAELEMLGYAEHEYIGRPIADFHADAAAIADILSRLGRNETLHNYEARLRCKGGSIKDVLISSNVYRENGEFVHTRCFTRDVTEQRRIQAALKDADRRKDEFLATLAHELRNPLAPVLNSARLLGYSTTTNEQKRFAVDVIDRQVNRMRLLLDELLDISRITRGQLALRKEAVCLSAIIGDALEIARPAIEAKQHHFSFTPPDADPSLQVDRLRMSQALANILTNAAKYSDPGSAIDLRIQLTDTHVVLSVRDTGIGIATEQLDSIFEMFSQVDSNSHRSQDGLGIGLALVKGIMELHGGSVSVMSEGPGCGSTFNLALPRSAISDASAAAT